MVALPLPRPTVLGNRNVRRCDKLTLTVCLLIYFSSQAAWFLLLLPTGCVVIPQTGRPPFTLVGLWPEALATRLNTVNLGLWRGEHSGPSLKATGLGKPCSELIPFCCGAPGITHQPTPRGHWHLSPDLGEQCLPGPTVPSILLAFPAYSGEPGGPAGNDGGTGGATEMLSGTR